jgi:hypothetical protein
VQVLTPTLDFYCFIGAGQRLHSVGVCSNADIVVTCEGCGAYRILVFSRDDGALLRRFGRESEGDGQLSAPEGLCFMADDPTTAT